MMVKMATKRWQLDRLCYHADEMLALMRLEIHPSHTVVWNPVKHLDDESTQIGQCTICEDKTVNQLIYKGLFQMSDETLTFKCEGWS